MDRRFTTPEETVKQFIPADTDDMATPDDLESHRIAMEEYAAGQTVPHDAVNWE